MVLLIKFVRYLCSRWIGKGEEGWKGNSNVLNL